MDIYNIIQQGQIFNFNNIEYWHNKTPANGIYLIIKK